MIKARLVFLFLPASIAVFAACSASGVSIAPIRPTTISTATATATASSSPMPSPALLPAAARIGVGAFVNPQATNGGPTTIVALESSIGRTLDYSMHYAGIADSFPTSEEMDDRTHGRIPILSLNCDSTKAITSGALNPEINALAASIAAYGATVEIRYCYEMNLPYNNLTPLQFIPMWRHVHDRFVAGGVTNVRWFWCPSNEYADPSSGIAYYPGDTYVDDAGYDAYDGNSIGFRGLMETIYPSYAAIGKPIIVGETGAMRTTDQSTYLGDDAANLIRTRYPLIHGVVYFDRDGALGAWAFSPDGLASFTSFAKAAR